MLRRSAASVPGERDTTSRAVEVSAAARSSMNGSESVATGEASACVAAPTAGAAVPGSTSRSERSGSRASDPRSRASIAVPPMTV